MTRITDKKQAVSAGYMEETWDDELGRPRCLAKSKQQERRCRQWPAKGKRVCRFHGARAGRPVIHGRYSKLLPARLAERYHESLADPEYLALRDEIALLDARIGELLAELAAQAREAEGGARMQAPWREVVALLEQRRKLAESERRWLVKTQQVLTVEQAMTLLAVVRDIIMRHVQDSSTRAAIAHELRSLAEGYALAPGVR